MMLRLCSLKAQMFSEDVLKVSPPNPATMCAGNPSSTDFICLSKESCGNSLCSEDNPRQTNLQEQTAKNDAED